jgi:hypothetical protein
MVGKRTGNGLERKKGSNWELPNASQEVYRYNSVLGGGGVDVDGDNDDDNDYDADDDGNTSSKYRTSLEMTKKTGKTFGRVCFIYGSKPNNLFENPNLLNCKIWEGVLNIRRRENVSNEYEYEICALCPPDFLLEYR